MKWKLLAAAVLALAFTAALQGQTTTFTVVGESVVTCGQGNPPSLNPLADRNFIELRSPTPGAPNLNRITKGPLGYRGGTPTPYFFAVGDQGKVIKIQGTYQGATIVSEQTLDAAYDLTGVAFGTDQVGYIVGYKRADWTGILYKTVDQGAHWAPQTNMPYITDIPVPFLSVDAAPSGAAMIGCGYGWVLATTLGDVWTVTNKPLNHDHYGWFWGVAIPNPAIQGVAYVASDVSDVFAKTTD